MYDYFFSFLKKSCNCLVLGLFKSKFFSKSEWFIPIVSTPHLSFFSQPTIIWLHAPYSTSLIALIGHHDLQSHTGILSIFLLWILFLTECHNYIFMGYNVIFRYMYIMYIIKSSELASLSLHLPISFYCRIFEVYSLRYFEIYYTSSTWSKQMSKPISPVYMNLYTLWSITAHSLPPRYSINPWQPLFCSLLLWVQLFLDSTYNWDHVVFVFLYLVYIT